MAERSKSVYIVKHMKFNFSTQKIGNQNDVTSEEKASIFALEKQNVSCKAIDIQARTSKSAVRLCRINDKSYNKRYNFGKEGNFTEINGQAIVRRSVSEKYTAMELRDYFSAPFTFRIVQMK